MNAKWKNSTSWITISSYCAVKLWFMVNLQYMSWKLFVYDNYVMTHLGSIATCMASAWCIFSNSIRLKPQLYRQLRNATEAKQKTCFQQTSSTLIFICNLLLRNTCEQMKFILICWKFVWNIGSLNGCVCVFFNTALRGLRLTNKKCQSNV